MKATLTVLAILLAGCAGPQMPTNANPAANFDADRSACQQVAAGRPAPAAPAPSPAQASAMVTNCRPDGTGGAQCVTVPVAPRKTATEAMMDTMAKLSELEAQQNFDRAWHACMMAKGWR